MWDAILGWPQDEYLGFVRSLQSALRKRGTHVYVRVRYVYGMKPEAA